MSIISGSLHGDIMSEEEHTIEGNKPDVEYLDSPDKSENDKAEYSIIYFAFQI